MSYLNQAFAMYYPQAEFAGNPFRKKKKIGLIGRVRNSFYRNETGIRTGAGALGGAFVGLAGAQGRQMLTDGSKGLNPALSTASGKAKAIGALSGALAGGGLSNLQNRWSKRGERLRTQYRAEANASRKKRRKK